MTSTPLRWCLYGLAAFQALIAVLLLINWDSTVSGLGANRGAAEGSAAGSLVLHVIFAVLYVALGWKAPTGRRRFRVLATVVLAVNAIGGIITMITIADVTPLNPIGVALAIAALILMWTSARIRPSRQPLG